MTNHDDATRLDSEAARRCASATRQRANLIAERGGENCFATAAYLDECAQIIDSDMPEDQRAHLAMIHAVMTASRAGAQSARLIASALVAPEDKGELPPDAPKGEAGAMLAAAALLDPTTNADPSTWVIHNPEDWAAKRPDDGESPAT
ncbi:hypothetical protein [Candidatus Poriferisodalis sp.]|uniref:hypothetical protein n=1 Tax=Candidatus Poriferisodalis sp. TaxID=3101277 RepID=UPI003B522F53